MGRGASSSPVGILSFQDLKYPSMLFLHDTHSGKKVMHRCLPGQGLEATACLKLSSTSPVVKSWMGDQGGVERWRTKRVRS